MALPCAVGEIIGVDTRHAPGGRHHLYLVVVFKFSLAEDGRYTGESYFSPVKVMNITKEPRIGRQVPVRYRRDDPSVNELDPSFWDEFEGL